MLAKKRRRKIAGNGERKIGGNIRRYILADIRLADEKGRICNAVYLILVHIIVLRRRTWRLLI